jgi:hypothetical protein
MLRRGKAIKAWQYESKTFWFENIRRGTRSYMPDFEVINPDGSVCYYECKGYLETKDVTKFRRLAQYHRVPLILVMQTIRDRDWYRLQKAKPYVIRIMDGGKALRKWGL